MTPEEQKIIDSIAEWRRQLIEENNRQLERLVSLAYPPGIFPEAPAAPWFMSTVGNPATDDLPPDSPLNAEPPQDTDWRSRPPML